MPLFSGTNLLLNNLPLASFCIPNADKAKLGSIFMATVMVDQVANKRHKILPWSSHSHHVLVANLNQPYEASKNTNQKPSLPTRTRPLHHEINFGHMKIWYTS
jgi:hypothetical protein